MDLTPVVVRDRETEPLPWALLTDDGLIEVETLDEAVETGGLVMRRFSAICHIDGVWSAQYRKYGWR